MTNLQKNTAKPDASFWKKKAAASFLMSVLIFFIHLSTFYNYTDTGNVMSAVNRILALTFKEGFTRFVARCTSSLPVRCSSGTTGRRSIFPSCASGSRPF